MDHEGGKCIDSWTMRQRSQQQTHIAHRQQPLVKEEDDAQDGEEEAESRQAHPDFCVQDVRLIKTLIKTCDSEEWVHGYHAPLLQGIIDALVGSCKP